MLAPLDLTATQAVIVGASIAAVAGLLTQTVGAFIAAFTATAQRKHAEEMLRLTNAQDSERKRTERLETAYVEFLTACDQVTMSGLFSPSGTPTLDYLAQVSFGMVDKSQRVLLLAPEDTASIMRTYMSKVMAARGDRTLGVEAREIRDKFLACARRDLGSRGQLQRFDVSEPETP